MSEEIARTKVIRLKNTSIKCLKIRPLKSKPFVIKNDTEDTTINRAKS